MSKFCGNCGCQLDDDARVCGQCGNVVSGGVPVNNIGNSSTEKKGSKKLIIGVVAAVAVITVAVIVIISVISSNSYKAVVDTYINSSLVEADATALMELLPEEFISYTLEEEDMSRREAAEDLQEMLDDVVDMLDSNCDDWSISYEIIDTHDSSKSEIEELSEDCEDLYGFTVSDEKEVTVELTVSATVDGETEDKTNDVDITVIKVDGSWCLWSSDGSMFDNMLY